MQLFGDLSLLKWLYKHARPIIIVEIIAVTLSIIFSSSYFMPPKYESEAIVYPNNLWEYSHESPSEQMMEFLNSVNIKNAVIDKFNLRKHYGLKNSEPYLKELYGEYDDNILTSPTEYSAVNITVHDVSPDTAYEIIQSLLDFLNKKINEVQKEKSIELVKMWQVALNKKKHEIDSLTSYSKQLSEQYGLLEYSNQTKELTKAYYQVLSAGKDSKHFDEISQQIKNVEVYGVEFQALTKYIELAYEDYSNIESKYEDALKDVDKNVTYWSFVSAPYKPDGDYYPIRFLIIIGVCLVSFIFSVLVIKTLEKIEVIKSN